MSTVSNATTTTTTGVDGNSVTSAVSNDQLTSEDFLKLMLEEMKMQDPTNPMDTDKLMDSQLKMSTIESNLKMANAMESLQASYSTSALSTAANLIGNVVEDGSTNDQGDKSTYKVATVENKDGELYVNAYEITGMVDALVDSDSGNYVLYDADGVIYEDDGTTPTNYKVALDSDGRFTYNDDGSLKILDLDNNIVTDETVTSKYKVGGSAYTYADDLTTIPVGNITTVK